MSKRSIFFNPLYLCERALEKAVSATLIELSISKGNRWLDVGCGTRPYEKYFPVGTYTGVDVMDSGRDTNLKCPDFYYDGEALPFPDDSFDGVLSTQVLEHVRHPESFIKELARVLKPNGHIVITIPFVWQEHEIPYDFTRKTEFGMCALLEDEGFLGINVKKLNGFFESSALLLNAYVVNNLVPPIKGAGTILVLLVCFPVQIIGYLIQRILPDKKYFYLNLMVSARKYSNK